MERRMAARSSSHPPPRSTSRTEQKTSHNYRILYIYLQRRCRHNYRI